NTECRRSWLLNSERELPAVSELGERRTGFCAPAPIDSAGIAADPFELGLEFACQPLALRVRWRRSRRLRALQTRDLCLLGGCFHGVGRVHLSLASGIGQFERRLALLLRRRERLASLARIFLSFAQVVRLLGLCRLAFGVGALLLGEPARLLGLAQIGLA